MFKIMFINEEKLPEITQANRIFIDSENKSDIVIVVIPECIRIRVHCVDYREAVELMQIFFNADHINLIELQAQNDNISVEIETVNPVDIYNAFAFPFPEDWDDDEDFDYGLDLGDEDIYE